MNEALDLLNKKERLFEKLLEYVKKETFEYTEEDVRKFKRYVKNINQYLKSIGKVQAEIDKLYESSEYGTDKEVCAVEEKCKKIAKEIYDIDKEVNDKMQGLTDSIMNKYKSAKKQVKLFNYNVGTAVVSESLISFDVKK